MAQIKTEGRFSKLAFQAYKRIPSGKDLFAVLQITVMGLTTTRPKSALPIGISSTKRMWLAAVVLTTMFVSLPVLLVEVPPLTDYPNHLARSYVIDAVHDPILRSMFSIEWRLIPNIAFDVIVPALDDFVSTALAGRIAIVMSIALFVTGLSVYSAAITGRFDLLPVIIAGLLALNGFLLTGLLNFQISLGLALWSCAAWVKLRPRFSVVTFTACVVSVFVVYFAHVYGYFFFAVIICSYEFGRIWRDRCGLPKSLDILLIFAVLIGPPLLFLLSPTASADAVWSWSSLGSKLHQAVFVVTTYHRVLTIAAAVYFFLLASAVATGIFRLEPSAAFAGTIFLLTVFIAPSSIGSTYWVDARTALLAATAFAAGLMPGDVVHLQARRVAVLAASCLLVARTASVGLVWNSAQPEIADLRLLLRNVPPASRVVVVQVTGADNPVWYQQMPANRRIPGLGSTFGHLAAFVVIDRKSFWPNIFADRSQQPLVITSGFSHLAGNISDGVPSLADLLRVKVRPDGRFPFLANWQLDFDYLLVLNADGASAMDLASIPNVEPAGPIGFAALFRIVSGR